MGALARGTEGVRRAGTIRTLPAYQSTPILLLSSGSPNDNRAYHQCGIQRQLLKPVTRVDLLETLLSLSAPSLSAPQAAEEPQSVLSAPACVPQHRAHILVAEDN